jgi:type I restriction enzyme, S subunit
MKWPAYPKYKPSGVDWLGDIPAHWDEIPVRRRAKRIQTGGTPPTAEERYYEEGTVPWYGPGSFDNQIAVSNPVKLLNASAVSEGAARVFAAGATMIVTIGATLGKVSSLINSGSCNQQITVIEFDERRVHPRFATYQLKRLEPVLRTIAPSATLPILDQGEIADIVLGLPPLPEQLAVAAFLDRETSRIDRLVEKKRELIERLKEKRTALISRTVTRGLPPAAARAAGLPENPPLKSSGLEWLGDVPEHWDIKRIKQLGLIRYGLGEPPEYADDGIPFIRATDIKRGKIDLDAVKKVSYDDIPWSRRPQLNLNEILVVRSGAYTGDSAIVSQEVAGFIAGYDMVLTVHKANSSFIAWVLLSKYMLYGQIYLERLRAAQPHLNAEELGGFTVLVPPRSEQVAIAAYLDTETVKLDSLMAKVETAIERLQEYRTALITATVTGKIDVREDIA